MSSVSLSVRLSVTLVDCDHISWNSSEIISPLVSLGCSLSADPNIRGLLQGEHPEILAQSATLVDLSVERHSIANCGQMVTGSATVTMERLEETTIAVSNGAIAEPTTSPSPKIGFPVLQKYANGHISATSDSMHFMFGSK